jgi:hypothetical protein
MRRSLAIVTMTLALLVSCKATKNFFGRFRSSVDPVIGPWEEPRSLESGPDSNGAIVCAANVFPNVLTHSNTDMAFANVVSAAGNSDTVVLIGHGTAGAICTGDGDTCRTPGALIRAQNENLWKTSAGQLKNAPGVTTLRLLACGVGASAFGRQLLQELADDTGCVVLGPKTMVFCQNGRLEVDRGLWEKAIPHAAHTPLAAPPAPLRPSRLQLFSDGKLTEIAAADFPVDFKIVQSLESGNFVTLPKDDARRLVEMIDFGERPFRADGPALSVRTGTVAIDFPPPLGRRTFTIYSDIVALDDANPHWFYRTSAGFADEIARARR